MKHAVPLLAIGGLVLATAAFAVMSYASPTSTRAGASFVRPQFERARPDGVLDLKRFSTLGLRQELDELAENSTACHDALDAANIRYTQIASVQTPQGCGFDDGVVLSRNLIAHRDAEPLQMTCALAARLYLWEREIVAPAAEKYLGSSLTGVEALGSYSCRRIAGMERMSEHAFGKAADISAFRLADGRKVSVLKSYHSKGPEGAFLREIHDRACDLFDVTLGPNYNADHANHFHLDIGGESSCR